ncbi:hypothetical protein GE061_004349 [Apolygus lucorum]|uniref:Chitin-binding type-2 domain-containing protein n=1 Tax=Apolygus lucorum TaxID=248454 RepID=A0A8S9WZ46_APOLU|nr:hypothetical protein GE061_004349 [Apolygus lucorum]
MGSWMGLLLIVVVYTSRCSKCAQDGRILTSNEFPETVYIEKTERRKNVLQKDDKPLTEGNEKNTTKHICMGLIQDSITIITSASCNMKQMKRNMKDITIRTPENVFFGGKNAFTYPIARIEESDDVIVDISPAPPKPIQTGTKLTCTREGFFTHPDSCRRFYRCVKYDHTVPDAKTNFSIFEFDCPPGDVVFDESLSVCNWPYALPEGSRCRVQSGTTHEPLIIQDSNFTFVVIHLVTPGIILKPDDHKDLSNSTGKKAATWMTDPDVLQNITDNGISGVVTTPDMKVVAMTLLVWEKCREKWSVFTKDDPADHDVLLENAVCAVQARHPISFKDNHSEPVPPGHVCDEDYGSPFIYDDEVVGILVRAFCNETGELPMAVFLNYQDFIGASSTPMSQPTNHTKPRIIGAIRSRHDEPVAATRSIITFPPRNDGFANHPKNVHASILSIMLLAELELFNLNKFETCYS